MSAALVLLGVVALVTPRPTEVSYQGTFQLLHGRAETIAPIRLPSLVLARGQVVAALVVTVGLLLAGWLVGLTSGRRHPPDAGERPTAGSSGHGSGDRY